MGAFIDSGKGVWVVGQDDVFWFFFPLLERRGAFVGIVARAVEVAQYVIFQPRRHKFPSPKSGTNSWIKANFVYE